MKNVNRKEKKDSDKICFESHDCILAVKNEELTESPGIVVRIITKELYKILILLP